MSYERVMGIHVIDDDEYQKYREGMRPILESFGGFFGFDFLGLFSLFIVCLDFFPYILSP